VEADVDEARGRLRRGHGESLAEEGSNKALKQKRQRFEYGALPASEKDNAETQSTQSSEEKRKPGGLA
jgi:hypothetical protein